MRATSEAVAPGSSDAATSRSFSSCDHRRRRSTDVITSAREIVIALLLGLPLGPAALASVKQFVQTRCGKIGDTGEDVSEPGFGIDLVDLSTTGFLVDDIASQLPSLEGYTIHNILASELCVGRMTYNVTTKRLQGRAIKNPESAWARFQAFEPIVPPAQFRKAQERLAVGNRPWDKEKIVASLKRLLDRNEHLYQRLLNSTKGAPSADTVDRHFGSLCAAYAAAGYDPTTRMFFGNNGLDGGCGHHGAAAASCCEGRISNRLIERCPDLPCPKHIRHRFGSLANALRKACLPRTKPLRDTARRMETQGRRRRRRIYPWRPLERRGVTFGDPVSRVVILFDRHVQLML